MIRHKKEGGGAGGGRSASPAANKLEEAWPSAYHLVSMCLRLIFLCMYVYVWRCDANHAQLFFSVGARLAVAEKLSTMQKHGKPRGVLPHVAGLLLLKSRVVSCVLCLLVS